MSTAIGAMAESETGSISPLTIEAEGRARRVRRRLSTVMWNIRQHTIFTSLSTLVTDAGRVFRGQPSEQNTEECTPVVHLEPAASGVHACVQKLTGLCRRKVSFEFDTVEKLEQSCRGVEQPDQVGIFSLTNTTLISLPLSIARFSNLTEILMPHNKISELPWSLICLRKLRVLDLSHNKLSTVPSLLGYVQSLEVLRLSHNNLTVLPTSLINLTRLTELSLGMNKMTSPPQQICDEGLEAVLTVLRSRLGRANLWAKTYNGPDDSNSVRTLMEVCVQCILDCQLDILNAPVPPMLKNYLMEEKSLLERRIQLAKCDQCRGYFSSVERFNNHHCRNIRPPQNQ